MDSQVKLLTTKKVDFVLGLCSSKGVIPEVNFQEHMVVEMTNVCIL